VNYDNYNNLGRAMATQAAIDQQSVNMWNAQNVYQKNTALGPALLTPAASLDPMRIAFDERVKRLTVQLSLRALSRIVRVEYMKEVPPRIVIRYDNMRELDLFDVENFPSDEHISRILLELP
jgi:hypothetical protein